MFWGKAASSSCVCRWLPTDTPQPPSPVTETGQPTTRPLRVLVVDDNVDTVLSFSMLLKASGHDVRTAHDGPTAVQAALDYRPDVVLLDIGLPGLNGYEVAKRIRQHPVLKNVVLVALTGYGQDSDRQTSLQAGFNHHLVKPARLEQLQQILATVSAFWADSAPPSNDVPSILRQRPAACNPDEVEMARILGGGEAQVR